MVQQLFIWLCTKIQIQSVKMLSVKIISVVPSFVQLNVNSIRTDNVLSTLNYASRWLMLHFSTLIQKIILKNEHSPTTVYMALQVLSVKMLSVRMLDVVLSFIKLNVNSIRTDNIVLSTLNYASRWLMLHFSILIQKIILKNEHSPTTIYMALHKNTDAKCQNAECQNTRCGTVIC